MVFLFRLLGCLFTAPLKKRLGPLDESVITMRVWPNDLDLNIHANSSRYVGFMDVGRVDMVGRWGILWNVLKRGWRPIVGGSMITYRRSLRPFEKFRVRSRIVAWDEKWFYFEHVVERLNGDVSAMSSVRGLARGPGGNVPPAEFMALAGHLGPSPELPAYIAQWLASEARK